jgi:hypothetical protein
MPPISLRNTNRAGDCALCCIWAAVLSPRGVNTTGPVKWDPLQVSEYFEYFSPIDGALHQVSLLMPGHRVEPGVWGLVLDAPASISDWSL